MQKYNVCDENFWIAQIQAIGHTTGQPKSRKKVYIS